MFLKILQNSQQNTYARASFLRKLPPTLFEKRLWHMCFPVNFAKLLKTPVLRNTSGRLLLHISFEISKCNGFSETFGNFIYFLFEFFLVVWNFKFFSLFSLPNEENDGKLAFWKSICYNPVSIFITQFVESFCCNWLF